MARSPLFLSFPPLSRRIGDAILALLTSLIPAATLRPYLVYIALPLAVATGLWGYGRHQHSLGYAQASAQWAAAAAAEKARVESANAVALAAATRRVSELRDANADLERQLTENVLAAAKDPRRNRCSLGAAGVRRVDSIR